ncbi:MAG: creatininase family protein [bacterium]|nr:creatininase family protein [bacterium]
MLDNLDRDIRLEFMAWPKVRDRILAGWRTAVVAVGSTEQHGPHLPICTDELLGTALACGVARRLGDALVAPTVRPGFSPHHLAFPGTLTVGHDTLAAVIGDYCESLAAHGFTNIAVLCSHGGNSPTIRLACHAIQRRLPRVHVVPIYDLMQYATGDRPFFGREEGLHANLIETAWMLHLAPHLVDMSAAVDEDIGLGSASLKDAGVPLFHGSVAHLSASGVLGRPRGATAKLGAEVFERMVDLVADEVRSLIAWFENKPAASDRGDRKERI